MCNNLYGGLDLDIPDQGKFLASCVVATKFVGHEICEDSVAYW